MSMCLTNSVRLNTICHSIMKSNIFFRLDRNVEVLVVTYTLLFLLMSVRSSVFYYFMYYYSFLVS
jgi:hypothetical protein